MTQPKIVRSFLILSDLHGGSPYAVSDEQGIWTDEGLHILPNDKQLLIYRTHWKEMEKSADDFNVDTVLTLGDMTDGTNYKECGYRMMTPDLELQRDFAARMLEKVCTDRDVYSVSGSPYHESREMKIHRQLAHQLRDVATKSEYLGVLGFLTVDPVDKILSIAHKASNAMLYTATMADRELLYDAVAKGQDQLPDIHYEIRGHLHKVYHIDNGFRHFLQVGAWKSWYPIKGSTQLHGRMQSDIGWSILQYDEAGRSRVINWRYNAPRIAVKELKI